MMCRIRLLGWMMLLCHNALMAQELSPVAQYTDSMVRKIDKMENVEDQIHGFLELSFFLSDYDVPNSHYYLEKAASLMPEDKTDYQQGLLSFYEASILFNTDTELAKKTYLEADRHFVHSEDPRATRYRVRLWGAYGILFQKEGQKDRYVDVLLNQTIPLAQQLGDTLLMATSYQNLAVELMNQQQYDHAEKHYTRALSLLENASNANNDKLTAFINYARNSLYQDRLAQTRALLDSAASIAKLIPSNIDIPLYYSLEGAYWKKKGEFAKAIAFFDQGLSTSAQAVAPYLTNFILYEKYELYKTMGDWPSAKATLQQVHEYVDKSPSLRDKQILYHSLAVTEGNMGNYKGAVQWYEKYKLITDSIMTANNSERILELEKKYQTSQKDRELLQLNNEKEKQQLIIQRNKILLTVLAVLALLLAVFAWTIRENYGQKKLLIEQEQKLLSEERKLMQQEERLKLFNAMVQGQERERNRIARDLHDGLGGMLASVKIKLSSLASNEGKLNMNKEHQKMELYPIIEQLDNSANELRRIARNMMPESLLYIGLAPALKDLCQSFDTPQRRVKFESINLNKSYPQPFLIAIYRIVQELLTNAAKHGQADQVVVQCSEHENHFYLTVEDNGIGFDVHKQDGNGIGLSNVKTRVDLLSGTLEIESKKGRGTTFNIEIKHGDGQ